MMRVLLVVAGVYLASVLGTFVVFVDSVETRVIALRAQQGVLTVHLAELQEIAHNLNQRRAEQVEVRREIASIVHAALGDDPPSGVSVRRITEGPK